ncbi:MAG: TerB family tellurite resistance protein [Candidatus Eremiobacteraeota bacterium]|nr:TerB family tellurite resistance protein [Candidatus Eremiobacteraeota bacterium]
MEKYSFEAIEPLLTQVEQDGEVVFFTFRCPATGLEIEAPIVPGQEQLASLEEAPKEGFFGVLATIFGSEDREDWEERDYTRDEIEDAAVMAFQAVAADFVWDGARWTWWEANDAVVRFFEQLEEGAVQDKSEQDLLKRVLTEVLRSDGVVAQEEIDLFADLVGETPEGGKGLFSREPLEERELTQVKDRSVRETMLMLGYAMACCDDELAHEEVSLLERYAEALEIPDLRAWELRRFAQCYVVDERFSRVYGDGGPDPVARGEVVSAGEKIGLDLDEISKIEFRYRKRSGIAS